MFRAGSTFGRISVRSVNFGRLIFVLSQMWIDLYQCEEKFLSHYRNQYPRGRIKFVLLFQFLFYQCKNFVLNLAGEKELLLIDVKTLSSLFQSQAFQSGNNSFVWQLRTRGSQPHTFRTVFSRLSYICAPLPPGFHCITPAFSLMKRNRNLGFCQAVTKGIFLDHSLALHFFRDRGGNFLKTNSITDQFSLT